MIKFKTILNKPANVSWNKALTLDVLQYISNNIVGRGRVHCIASIFNGNEQTTVIVFETMNDCLAYFTDPNLISWHTARNTYNAESGIVESLRETTEITADDPEFIELNGVFGARTVEEPTRDILYEFLAPGQ